MNHGNYNTSLVKLLCTAIVERKKNEIKIKRRNWCGNTREYTRKCTIFRLFFLLSAYLSVRLFCLCFIRSYILACSFIRMPLCFVFTLCLAQPMRIVCTCECQKIHSFIHSLHTASSAHASITLGSVNVCVCQFVWLCVCALYVHMTLTFLIHTHFIQQLVPPEVGSHRGYDKRKSFDKPNRTRCYSWIPIHANPPRAKRDS